MTKPYMVADWYWYVAGDQTRAYSSRLVDYVPLADSTLQAWIAGGGTPSRIASEQELWDYLNGRAIDATPANANSSDASKTTRVKEQMSEVVGQILFDHENRIRTLESKPTITRQQFVNHIKTLMK